MTIFAKTSKIHSYELSEIERLPSVLFEDDDILAIDKPYGFNAHTNDSKVEHADFVQDGLIEIYEKALQRRLHVIHRLDQTTTGVMIFGKSAEGAKKYADFFFNRQVKKTYWFVTKHRSRRDEFSVERAIVHKGRELSAQTSLKLLKKDREFELWEANPRTGRNHQIRIHALASQIPILGDLKYEGASFPFLCLHNCRIEFPNGVVISSVPPRYFENLELLENLELCKLIFEADRRSRLFAAGNLRDQSFRLSHNIHLTEDPGFTIDQYGKQLVLSWYREEWDELTEKMFAHYSSLVQLPILVRLMAKKEILALPSQRMIFPDGQQSVPPAKWTAKEEDSSWECHAGAGSVVGAPLNQRLQRAWVRRNARELSVLSLFAGSGGYSLAAALGGATEVTSVDGNKNSLAWARENFVLNGLLPDSYKFFCRDSIHFLEQCQAKNMKFDLITCDAPSFQKRDKRIFKLKDELEPLIARCLGCLTAQGALLFSTTFDGFFVQDLKKAFVSTQQKMKMPELEVSFILPSLDFELPYKRTQLKSFLIRFQSARPKAGPIPKL